MVTQTQIELSELLAAAGQQHLLHFWDKLHDGQCDRLAAEIRSVDFQQVRLLHAGHDDAPDWSQLADRAESPPAVRTDGTGSPLDAGQAKARGDAALRNGQLGVILVAGGQGTRLGFNHPKGMYQLGPISNRPLFQIIVDQLLAVSKRYGVNIPLYLMTSPATHDETVSFFAANDHFGLPAEDLQIFCQGTMPAVDATSGKLLLAERDRLFLSPDGHGGMLQALDASGCLDDAQRRGIKQLYYCQVDNPLAQVCDPSLIGYHLLAESEMTTQVVKKVDPLERVGNVVSIDGQVRIIEYSDLPTEAAERRREDGGLALWAGNIAVHVFNLDFLARMKDNDSALPFHLAHKAVPYIDESGMRVKPTDPNAIKFERFIFDLLPWAKNAIVVEGNKDEVFAPVKNHDGAATDTPELARQAMINLHSRWLTEAGAKLSGKPIVEINPRFALDVDELRAKLPENMVISKSMYFS